MLFRSHAGNLPGYPASHGCVRLPREFAKQLFGITKLGLTVVITDDPLVPEIVPSPAILASASGEKEPQNQSYRWHPEKSATGPLSIVLAAVTNALLSCATALKSVRVELQLMAR